MPAGQDHIPVIRLSDFRDILPYAAETVGVHQPLIGWRSARIKERIRVERVGLIEAVVDQMLFDPRVREAVEADLNPIDELRPDIPGWIDPVTTREIEDLVRRRRGGANAGSWRRAIPELVQEFSTGIREIRRGHSNRPGPLGDRERLLAGAEMLAAAGDSRVYRLATPAVRGAALREALETRRAQLIALGGSELDGNLVILPTETADRAGPREDPAPLALRRGVIRALAGAHEELLGALTSPARGWEQLQKTLSLVEDPPGELKDALLSPIGVIHLFRQFYYDICTFSGPTVGSVWVSPGGSVELYEVQTRRTLQERYSETTIETTRRVDSETIEQDELSATVAEENLSNTQFGISASGGFNAVIAQGSASGEYSVSSSVKRAANSAQKHSRQQTDRVSTELRRNYKTSFRETVSREDVSARRHLITNSSKKLKNYVFRRRMRLVGVQMRHVGVQLAWNVFVDQAGADLGIGKLVHIAKTADTTEPLPPEAPPQLPVQSTDFEFRFPWAPDAGADENELYVQGAAAGSDKRIAWTRDVFPPPPAAGYTLTSVTELAVEGTNPGKWRPLVNASYEVKDATHFTVSLQQARFYGNDALRFSVRTLWAPPDQTAVFDAYQKKLAEFDLEQRQRLHKEYVELARERTRLARSVRTRSSQDLRAEERSAIYRRLIQQLTQISGSPGDNNHTVSELLRTIFDLDQMLYFVAPDWWLPSLRSPLPNSGVNLPGLQLTPDDIVGGEVRGIDRYNYAITEDSEPAALGASLGWLLQLDGDDHRNAFLNAAWVKAVLPISPGYESAAVDWLARNGVEGNENFDVFRPRLKQLARAIALSNGVSPPDEDESASRLVPKGDEEAAEWGKKQLLYEHGFDPLEDGFRLDERGPFDTVTDWWEIVPTDQTTVHESEGGVDQTGSVRVIRPKADEHPRDGGGGGNSPS
jgi:hypothetical protein